MPAYNPSEDGVTHLNIWSKGKTKLGRILSNFAKVPVDLPEGRFDSIEGYWGYLGMPDDDSRKEEFKHVSGYNAKKKKQDIFKSGVERKFDPDFKSKIEAAIDEKFKTDEVQNCLKENKSLLGLPVVHYYIFDKDGRQKCMDVTDEFPEFINPIRRNLKKYDILLNNKKVPRKVSESKATDTDVSNEKFDLEDLFE